MYTQWGGHFVSVATLIITPTDVIDAVCMYMYAGKYAYMLTSELAEWAVQMQTDYFALPKCFLEEDVLYNLQLYKTFCTIYVQY